MKGRVIEVREKMLAGIEVHVEMEPGMDLSRAWENYIEVLQEMEEIKNLRECYGYCRNYMEEEGKASFDYLMAMESSCYDIIPKGFSEWVLPAGRYAVYTYRGTITPEKMRAFNEDIYTRQLAEDGFEILRNEGIEYYGEKYKHGEEDSEFEMWVPVK